ncbi:hypothetical protein [Curtobacterium sp. MCSS17_007]|uniref:hypothetical protein n=1 Tax=Curtobacterium sp. MCSS17_007 TaxID=2175646 RepID=UPI0015E8A83F|nr:hypothetical protein [Curtobacterium sp. MCSS17_007]WIE76697.1 hypothetical protein DEJ22_005400 [Curtobacterium sp. MCSS17_007]
MSTYEADQRVQQVKITSYRNLRRAARRGWVVPDGGVAPSLADLARVRGPGGGART